MVIYADLAVVLNFAVDLLLLLSANRLSGHGACWKRVLPAAAVGSLYGMLCLLPGMRFLGNLVWRILVWIFMSVIAYGMTVSGLRRGILFVFLSMALGGVALGIGKSGFWGIVASAALVCILCFVGFREPAGLVRHVHVVLRYRGKQLTVTGLVDTGNLLCDPLTGQQVLLLGADVGQSLVGLTDAQLRDPVSAIKSCELPGCRLIPYRSVGQKGGMLLAMNMDQVTIDGRQGGRLVAFAPEVLCREKTYQALVGGAL